MISNPGTVSVGVRCSINVCRLTKWVNGHDPPTGEPFLAVGVRSFKDCTFFRSEVRTANVMERNTLWCPGPCFKNKLVGSDLSQPSLELRSAADL